ncbi:MAG TPA: hypothetical protein VHS80_08925, partial [Chthoniobacterales bacterium]|nr:hypothetical protein [Chthoniobacterales bacterium]
RNDLPRQFFWITVEEIVHRALTRDSDNQRSVLEIGFTSLFIFERIDERKAVRPLLFLPRVK